MNPATIRLLPGILNDRVMTDTRPIVMVASPVYGIEELLNQVYALLEGYGYQVWMSYKGTVPVNSRLSNFENCLAAVDACDVFLGIVTGHYGTGQDAGTDEPSIFHREVQRAIAQDKLRYFLTHHNVTLARTLLKQFRFDRDGNRLPLRLRRMDVLDDVRILDMYDEIIRDSEPLSVRRGNWAQSYYQWDEALLFITQQFADPARIRALIGKP